jgi:hypothetical protein
MKRGNIWLIVGGVVLLAALIAFALSQFFGASRHVPFSVESPDRLGTKALFSLYQKRGVKATTWDGNEDSLPDTGGNTLHIIFPMKSLLPPLNVKSFLHGWARETASCCGLRLNPIGRKHSDSVRIRVPDRLCDPSTQNRWIPG